MKKYAWVAVCAVGLAMALSVYAEETKKDGPGAGGPGGHGNFNPEERFKAMDTDGNGTISLAEFKAGHEKRMAAMKERMGDKFDASKAPNPDETFKKIDKDGDGQLTKDELKAGHPAGGPGQGPGRREGGRGGRGHGEGAPKAPEAK